MTVDFRINGRRYGSLWTISGGSSSVGRALAFQAKGRGFEYRLPLIFCGQSSSGVEHFLGKEGVGGSIPLSGSTGNMIYNRI